MAAEHIKLRNFCFTLNNYEQKDIKHLKAICDPVDGKNDPVDKYHLKYMIFQCEVGEQGTPHLQGYIELNMPMSLAWIKNNIMENDKTHIEKRRGTAKEASDYCCKIDNTTVPDTTFVWGKISKQGARNDLKAIAEEIKEDGLKKTIDEHPETFLKLSKGMKELDQHYLNKKEKPIPTVYWYYGETGTGKSRDAAEEAGIDTARISGNLTWFDQYHCEDNVIFDDFRGDWCKLDYLLQILDIYDMKVPIKGGFVHWVPKKIFITSNKKPEECYYNCYGENIRQLLRRIHKIRWYKIKDGKNVFKQMKNEEPILNKAKATEYVGDDF